MHFFFFKQKTAYDMRISDWSSDVCSSDLQQVYVCDDVVKALAQRPDLPEGALYVVREGHLVDRHSVRFYAPDSEQAGMLARQQEIENLRRDLKASQLIADQALAGVARAEGAWQQVSQSMGPARQRAAG